MGMATTDKVRDELEKGRRELLDLGLRNPLLNYRPPRGAKGVEIVDELSDEVFRILVREERAMDFLSRPGQCGDQDGGPEYLPQPEPTPAGGPAARHLDRHLQTNYSSADLQKRLRATEQHAKLAIEEQGVNILFLALGMLHWRDSNQPDTIRKAPLILVPVALSRANAKERFRLEFAQSEIETNVSLAEKLKEEHRIQFPAIDDDDDFTPCTYFERVRAAVAGQKGWAVCSDEIALAFFSFGKLLMYRDLDGAVWPERKKPWTHPILHALFSNRFSQQTLPFDDLQRLDEHPEVKSQCQIMDCDSSQLKALLKAKHCDALVIQGPPGTGKSQTIANLIADAVSRGERVLFVSEKMAALEVVKRRLDAAGLGDMCLELHSEKTRKSNVIDELRRTFNLGRPQRKDSSSPNVLDENRAELNQLCDELLREIHSSGVSPHDALCEMTALDLTDKSRREIAFQKLFDALPDRERLERCLLILRDIEQHLQQHGLPHTNPFFGSTLADYFPTDTAKITAAIDAACRDTGAFTAAWTEFLAPLGVKHDFRLDEVNPAFDAIRHATHVPSLLQVSFDEREWREHEERARTTLDELISLAEFRDTFADVLVPAAWAKDLYATRRDVATYGQKWWRFLSGSYRTARRQIANLYRGKPPESLAEQLAVVDNLIRWQETEQARSNNELLPPAFRALFGSDSTGPDTNLKTLRSILSWVMAAQPWTWPTAVQELARTASHQDGPALTDRLAEITALYETATVSLKAMRTLVGFPEGVWPPGLQESPLNNLTQHLTDLNSNLDRLRELVVFNHHGESLAKLTMGFLLKDCEQWSGLATKLAESVAFSWYEGLVKSAYSDRELIRRFDRTVHELRLKRFCEADRALFLSNIHALAEKHWEGIPRLAVGGDVAVLKREFEKKRRQKPIRQLLVDAGAAIQAIKPVFMMSPLSIVKFLAPNGPTFDLVVFDEASQVKPIDAMGAIIRGSRAIVVGDSKQMPPTSFFDRSVGGNEDDPESVTGDLDSILDLFRAQGAHEHMLSWHYRSRHQSLIAVSNTEFYDGRLHIFPSPEVKRHGTGLSYHHLPAAVYDRGGTRTNQEEAAAVAAAALRHAQEYPQRSLGVVAFSQAQMEAIDLELERLRRTHPEQESFFSPGRDEPFFIKNLENVQGDERDVIIISIGYGKDATGKLSQNFGPLNSAGGERRLNVLITRARESCQVFTNIDPAAIDTDRSPSKGVAALKRFLTAAKEAESTSSPETHPDRTPLQHLLATHLEKAGYAVVSGFGASGCFLDLAVRDPRRHDRYLLGVQLDGPPYLSSLTARDRDRLQPAVLRQMGWEIERVWLLDFVTNPAATIGRLLQRVKSMEHRDPTPVSSAAAKQERSNIARQEVALHELELKAVPYATAILQLDTQGYELHQLATDYLASYVQVVIAMEGPVHHTEIARRITLAAGSKRTGARIQAAVTEAVAFLCNQGIAMRHGDFYTLNGQEIRVRDRSALPGAFKKIDLVSPLEIREAVKLVASQSPGISRDELIRETLKLLGFRVTDDAAALVEAALGTLGVGQDLRTADNSAHG